jgi:uncharacterized membrane protein YgcG
MKRSLILAAMLLVPAAASANPFDSFVADSSEIAVVVNYCSAEFKPASVAEACWAGNGSSSKQFGSEGGSDGTGGDSGGEGGESPK